MAFPNVLSGKVGIKIPIITAMCGKASNHSLFFFLGLLWVFVSMCGLSQVAASRGLLFAVVHGLLIAMASLVVEHRL